MPAFNRLTRFLVLILVPISISGCLTCEKKEYVFQLTGVNSGKLTIKYINIFSSLIDSTAELTSDYKELTDLWYKGEKVEMDFPQVKKFRKRLYEENGTLCGEITLEFDDLSKVRLYRGRNDGPFIFKLSEVNDDGETFLQTNGNFEDGEISIISWPEDSRTLRFITKIATPDSTCVSMLKQWEQKQKSPANSILKLF